MPDFAPAHPGEVLREDFLKPLELSQYVLAGAIGSADSCQRDCQQQARDHF